VGGVCRSAHWGTGEFPTSDNEFDKWFTEKVVEVHGFDFSAPPPSPPERKT
jgi:hypothetical protein